MQRAPALAKIGAGSRLCDDTGGANGAVPRCRLGMRIVFLIALIFAFSAGEADARHRGHFRYGYGRHVPRMSLVPPPYALGRSAYAYSRQQTREFPPPTWQLQPPDPNWQGRRFVSPRGEAWLAFYASPADQETVSAHFKTLAFADGEEIVTLHASRDQLIVTGAKGDRVFYRKARLACDGRQWHHVALEFPFGIEERQGRSYELLVAQAARALDLADDDGCMAPTAGNPPRDD